MTERANREGLSLGAACVAVMVAAMSAGAHRLEAPPSLKAVTVADRIVLHYVERGTGEPVVFVHGSLSDWSYWNDEVAAFSATHRVVAYSRRYNVPNTNPIRPGYSALVDAEDLAGLITQLHLGRVHVIGHSYGALTALFLAVKHQELVRTLVLAEAPAVSLLAHLPGDQAALGKTTLADINTRMVAPMKAAFREGDREAGIRAFMAYVFNDPQAWDEMSPAARQGTLENAREWDATLVSGELFPALDPRSVQRIEAPALLLSGGKSYPFLALIDGELDRLLPRAHRVILSGATHQMWLQQPDECRKAVQQFWHRTPPR
jgi:non-heme chloroperoxidase